MKLLKFLILTEIILTASSCLKHGDLYKEPTEEERKAPLYLYPFDQGTQGIETEITVQVKENTDPSQVTATIPPLKYNKSWLFILSQDDCKHASYCFKPTLNVIAMKNLYLLSVAYLLLCLQCSAPSENSTTGENVSPPIKVGVFDGHGGAPTCIWETVAALRPGPEMHARTITSAEKTTG